MIDMKDRKRGWPWTNSQLFVTVYLLILVVIFLFARMELVAHDLKIARYDIDLIWDIHHELYEQVQEMKPSEEIYEYDRKYALECLEVGDHALLIRYCENNNIDYKTLMKEVILDDGTERTPVGS